MSAASSGSVPPAVAASPAPESLDSSILRVLMDTSVDRIYFKDRESRFVRNNLTHARALGVDSPEQCVGKTDFDFFSREHAARAFADEQEIMRTGVPVIGKMERVVMLDGAQRWAQSTKMPWHDAAGNLIGTFGVSRDVTALKDAEEKLTEERNLLRTIIDHLPSRLYVKDMESRYLLNNASHIALLGAKTQEDVAGRTTLDFFPGERGRQALADDKQVLSTGQSILNHEKSDFGEEGDVHWSLVTKVPLHDTRDRLVGLVGISHDITRRKKAENELRRRSTEMETDLRMARQIQEAFLSRTYPVFPRGVASEASTLRFAHRYIPNANLGGDFFDILQLSDTQCGVLVCDVMGHGVRAGLLTALIRGVVEEVGTRTTDPAHVLHEINQSLMPIIEHTGQPVFATVFFGVVDTAARTLAYGNAGHPAPLVVRAGGISRLAPENPEPAAGLLGDFKYSQQTCEFNPGDLFFGYTDGILEAGNRQGDMFGEEGLRRVLNTHRGRSGSEISDLLLREVQTYSDQSDFDDDVCLVAIEARQ